MKNERAISRFQKRQRLRSVNFGNHIRSTSWLANLSHLSQVGLLLLAGFGYFYTVQPLYTKALLEESIAKYEMELPALKQKNLELKNKLHISNEELLEIKKLVGHEKEVLDKLRRDLQSASIIAASQASKIAQGKVELSNQYKTLRLTALNGIKYNMERECYFFIVSASYTGVIDSKLVENVTSCIRNSPEQNAYFKSLLREDKAEIKSQVKIISARFAETGARVLSEQASQKKKAASIEQEIAEIDRQSKRLKVLLDVVINGIASISLSDLSSKNEVQVR